MRARTVLSSVLCLILALVIAGTPVLAAPITEDIGGNQSIFLPFVTHQCGSAAVAVLVDPTLLPVMADPNLTIRGSLDVWYDDLCKSGYTAVERVVSTTNPMEVRTLLANLYQEYPLEGVFLVGNIPYAWQLVTWPAWEGSQPVNYETTTYEIYNDLDGTFTLTPDYQPIQHQTYFYNRHTGQTDWELWVATLPMYRYHENPAMTTQWTIEAIKRYLAKNHAYRTGQYSLGKDYMTFEENYGDVNDMYLPYYLEWLKTGSGSWMPFSTSPTARLYMRVNDPAMAAKLGYTSDTYKQDLADGKADFFVHFGHGAYFGMGDLIIDYVRSHPINTAWYMSGGCNVGDPNYDNILTEMIYNPTSQVIVAHGDMGPGGNLVVFNIGEKYGDHMAAALTDHIPFGRAMLEFANGARDPNKFNAPLFQSIAIYGDPTLTLVR